MNYQVILDVAEIGPIYQPGHSHADTLSFELAKGQKLIVNSGISSYENRCYLQRSTKLHSTVEISEKIHLKFGVVLELVEELVHLIYVLINIKGLLFVAMMDIKGLK